MSQAVGWGQRQPQEPVECTMWTQHVRRVQQVEGPRLHTHMYKTPTWSSARANTVGNTPRSNLDVSNVRVVGWEAVPKRQHTHHAHTHTSLITHVHAKARAHRLHHHTRSRRSSIFTVTLLHCMRDLQALKRLHMRSHFGSRMNAGRRVVRACNPMGTHPS